MGSTYLGGKIFLGLQILECQNILGHNFWGPHIWVILLLADQNFLSHNFGGSKFLGSNFGMIKIRGGRSKVLVVRLLRGKIFWWSTFWGVQNFCRVHILRGFKILEVSKYLQYLLV